MWSSWLPLLLFLPYFYFTNWLTHPNFRVQIASNCTDYGSEKNGVCHGSRCYARTLLHQPEGAIQRLGCLSAVDAKENTLNCEDHLNQTEEICLESGSLRVCCCLSQSSVPCNRVWQLETVIPVVSHKDVVLLLLAVAISVALPICLSQLLGHRLIQVAMKMRASILRFETINFVIKVVVLLLFFAVCWIPVSPDCPPQPDGRIQLKMEFLFQVVGYRSLNCLGFLLPLTCLLLDGHRFHRVHRDGIAASQFIHMGLTTILIGLFSGSIIAWDYMQLENEQTNQICKKTWASRQLIAASGLLYLYAAIGLTIQFGAWKQRKINEYLLLEEEQEQRDREMELMVDDGPPTLMETAMSATTLRDEEYIAFSPRPFTLDDDGEGILTIQNLHLTDWLAIRLLCSIPLSYSIHPQKLVLPPLREVTVSVRTIAGRRLPQESKPTLMIQWFSVDPSAMLMDATRLWQKPFVQPRHQWKFFVLPIFHEQ